MQRLALPIAVLALFTGCLVGCRANVPTGRFACGPDLECPPDQRCIGGRCHGADVDGGAGSSADASIDAAIGPDDDAFSPIDAPSVPPDATRDATPDTSLDAAAYHRLRVLNAVETESGTTLGPMTVTVDGTPMSAPFGCAASFLVRPGDVEVVIQAGAMRTSPSIAVSRDTLVVIGRNAAGSLLPITMTDDIPTGGGPTTMRFVSLFHSSGDSAERTTHQFVSGLGSPLRAHELALGEATPDVDFTGDSFVAIGYVVGLTAQLLAGFTFEDPSSAIVVVTGSADQHPGLPGGPRAIVVPPVGEECATPVLPAPVLAAVHLGRERPFLAADVAMCQLGTGLEPAILGPGQVSGTTVTIRGLTEFGIAPRADDPCDTAMPRVRVLDLEDPTLLPGGPQLGRRYLAVLSGAIQGQPVTSWQVTVLEEPVPTTRSTTPPFSDVMRGFAHLAPTFAPFAVDVRDTGTGTVVFGPIRPRATARMEVDPIVVTRWEVDRETTTTLVAMFPVVTTTVGRTSSYFVLADGASAVRASVVHMPFSTPWTTQP